MTYRLQYLKNIVDKEMDQHMCSTQRILSKSQCVLAIGLIYYVVSIWFLFTTDEFFFEVEWMIPPELLEMILCSTSEHTKWFQ